MGETVVAWDDLAVHNTPGDLWVAVHGKAYNVTDFARVHPGGDLVLSHFGGRDASEAFDAYRHPAWVRGVLKELCVGPMATGFKEPRPKSAAKLQKLRRELEADGAFDLDTGFYICLSLVLACLLWGVVQAVKLRWLFLAAPLMSIFWQQLALMGHDIGHRLLTHSATGDSFLGVIVTMFLGVGVGWWKSQHNVHHAVPNHAHHDPDIQHMPFFALSNRSFGGLYSTFYEIQLKFDEWAEKFVAYQHITFLPILIVAAKWGFYVLTGIHLAASKRPSKFKGFEVLAFITFFLWFGTLVMMWPTWAERVAFVVLSHMGFCILHFQIVLNHWDRPLTDESTMEYGDWLKMQVGASTNVICPPWMDWLHGGLQYQIEHHVFPGCARRHLRPTSIKLKQLCQEMGVEYNETTILKGMASIIAGLRVTAMEARAFTKENQKGPVVYLTQVVKAK